MIKQVEYDHTMESEFYFQIIRSSEFLQPAWIHVWATSSVSNIRQESMRTLNIHSELIIWSLYYFNERETSIFWIIFNIFVLIKSLNLEKIFCFNEPKKGTNFTRCDHIAILVFHGTSEYFVWEKYFLFNPHLITAS